MTAAPSVQQAHTMNLYNIPRHWPPRGNESTGLMTLHGEVGGEFFIQLKDLHEPAWWTGVRFLCPPSLTDNRVITFSVELVDGTGVPVRGVGGSWTQRGSEWQPLPWPIPAAMAAAGSYQLRVRHNGPTNQWVTREVAFHELTGLDPRARYLFTGIGGVQWDGESRRFMDDPRFSAGYAVHIVPPMLNLLNTAVFY